MNFFTYLNKNCESISLNIILTNILSVSVLLQIYAVLLAAALTEDSALNLDPDSTLDSAQLDSQDKLRYAKTYCYANRGKSFGKRFDLARSCFLKARFFGPDICVVDPEDADAWVEGTCNDLVQIHNIAETFCPRTTTTPKPTTTTSEDDYVYEEAPPELDTTTTTTEVAVRPKPKPVTTTT